MLSRGVRWWQLQRGVKWLRQVRSLSRDIGQPTHYTHPELLAEGEVLPGIHKSEFADRRRNLMQAVAETHTGVTNDGHLVIIPGAPIKYMSADVPYRFHQDTSLLYLTGFREPDCVLLLESASVAALPEHRAILYVRPRDPFRELWDGPRAGEDGAVEFVGVDEAYSIDRLEEHLEKRYSSGGYSVWFNSDEEVHPKHSELIISSLTRSQEAAITSVHNPQLLVQRLRSVKSPAEIALMKKAGAITGQAFKQAMRATRPGVGEGQLEAVFENCVKTLGAQWMSFPPVVAGGNRANCLHYITNNRQLEAGQMVLMDAGCEFHGYASDVTRTWPVGGAFSAAQRELYLAVQRVKEDCTQMCRSGVSLNYLHSVSVDLLASELKAMGALSHRLAGSKLFQLMNRVYPHHVGHYLGMDTHDTMAIGRDCSLVAGATVTIEPGLYIPDDFDCDNRTLGKELQGTGIRLEDNVLVTDGRPEVLNTACPEGIEELTEIIGQSHSVQ